MLFPLSPQIDPSDDCPLSNNARSRFPTAGGTRAIHIIVDSAQNPLRRHTITEAMLDQAFKHLSVDAWPNRGAPVRIRVVGRSREQKRVESKLPAIRVCGPSETDG